MKIEIEDELFARLEKQVRGFHETPNDVIKRLLEQAEAEGLSSRLSKFDEKDVSEKQPLVLLVESAAYQRGDGKERYFEILRFLYRSDREKFHRLLEGYQRGSRVNISQKLDKIENSGNSTNPQKLDGTPYYVLTNLDNKRKREIIKDALSLWGYDRAVIACVIKSIPDSGISRARTSGFNPYSSQ